MSPRERVRRFVDGELDATAEAALLADAERDPALAKELDDARSVARALASLEPPPEPPPDFVNRTVLRAVQRRARAEADAGLLSRWLRPRLLRLRVTPSLLLLALALPALGAAWALYRNDAAVATLAPPASTEGAHARATEALVRLMLPAQGARSVAVAGDFNGWRTDDVFLEDPEGDGIFVGTLRLEPGSYAYMFVIDGQDWVTDPYAVNHRDDGFGNRNAVLRID